MITEQESRKKLENAVKDFKKGVKTAFDTIFDLTSDAVYRICCNITGDHHASEDIMQEVYMSVFKALPEFRAESAFFTWLYRIAVNKSLSFVRKKKPEKPAAEELPEVQVRDSSPEDEKTAEELDMLRQAISELPDTFRSIVVMRDIEGVSYEDIAEIEQVPVGTVRSRLNRGRIMVKELFFRKMEKDEV